ncbi:HU family DNA-binding protein [Bacteroides ihuae]|uniref:hypothetical protein n=1 Tax=Bacteroides ihuae TaxID=1852362 RepID=UPI001F3C8C73|nr:hypothetical protein [Bacteroides ihuae]
MRSAITALAEIVRKEMFAGRSVDLADLGSFKVISMCKRFRLLLIPHGPRCLDAMPPCKIKYDYKPIKRKDNE